MAAQVMAVAPSGHSSHDPEELNRAHGDERTPRALTRAGAQSGTWNLCATTTGIGTNRVRQPAAPARRAHRDNPSQHRSGPFGQQP